MIRVLLVVVAVLLAGCSTPTPAPPAPQLSATEAPPATTPRTPDPRRAATTNALYSIQLAAECPGFEPRNRVPRAERLDYLREVVDCMVALHAEPLAAQGIELSTPRLVEAGHDEVHLCPELGPQDWDANYCAVTRTITYRPDPAQFSTDPASDVFLMAHEFGHHLQAVSGIWVDAVLRHDAGRIGGPRLELQAMCLSAAMTGRGDSPVRIPDAEIQRQIRGMNGWAEHWTATHGSAEARERWAQAGLTGGTVYASCNTWSAPPDEVR